MDEENIIYKYKAINEYTLDSLRNKYHYFSKPSQLNDPFDCRILLDENFDKKSYKELAPDIEKIADCWRILSLTKDWKNKKMWGLYADSYNGICIGYRYYKTENNEVISLNRNNEIAKIKKNYDEKQLSGILRKIDYDSKKYHFNSGKEDAVKAIYDSIIKKDSVWKDENEIRVLLPLYDSDNSDLSKLNSIEVKMNYDEKELIEIIFGFNVSLKKAFEIKEMITANYNSKVKFYMIKPNYITNTLEKIELCKLN